MSRHPLSRLAQLDKAAQVTKPEAPQPRAEEPLSAEASTLSPHIIKCTEARKLNAQTPIFRCPSWADLPSRAWYLRCSRDGSALPALGLHRYPFYLFGRDSLCDYVLEHPSISSVHAALVFHKQHECFVLVDLGSTNGSRVNGTRVERQRPVPVPAGTTLRFGYSTRTYEVCMGTPPRSGGDVSASGPSTAADGSTGTDSAAKKRPREDTEEASASMTTAAAAQEDKPREVKALRQNTEPTETATCPPPKTEDATVENEPKEGEVLDRVHLYHLVVKHKDVENAISRAERNKGEPITRSRADAIDIANGVLSSHQDASGFTPNKADTGLFDRWTVEDFIAAVEAYSELATSKKKKQPGDLGMVERGTFSDEFDSAAFALRREEVSGPVETPLGIHLIYRCD